MSIKIGRDLTLVYQTFGEHSVFELYVDTELREEFIKRLSGARLFTFKECGTVLDLMDNKIGRMMQTVPKTSGYPDVYFQPNEDKLYVEGKTIDSNKKDYSRIKRLEGSNIAAQYAFLDALAEGRIYSVNGDGTKVQYQ